MQRSCPRCGSIVETPEGVKPICPDCGFGENAVPDPIQSSPLPADTPAYPPVHEAQAEYEKEFMAPTKFTEVDRREKENPLKKGKRAKKPRKKWSKKKIAIIAIISVIVIAFLIIVGMGIHVVVVEKNIRGAYNQIPTNQNQNGFLELHEDNTFRMSRRQEVWGTYDFSLQSGTWYICTKGLVLEYENGESELYQIHRLFSDETRLLRILKNP